MRGGKRSPRSGVGSTEPLPYPLTPGPLVRAEADRLIVCVSSLFTPLYGVLEAFRFCGCCPSKAARLGEPRTLGFGSSRSGHLSYAVECACGSSLLLLRRGLLER